MALRKLARDPERLDSLSRYAIYPDAAGRSLDDAERHHEFLTSLGNGLSESLANKSRLHGWRVQSLFEALIVELDAARLLRSEDEGTTYYEGSKLVKLPDYRLVLHDGETVLVEVKNVAPGKTDTSLSLGELKGLERYAELAGGRIALAHYWSAFNMWTLVDPAVLERSGDRARLQLSTAGKANEMGLIGDAYLATTPPLVFSLRADPNKPASLGPERKGAREAQFTIGEVQVRVADQLIENSDERRIAMAMILYGSWREAEEPEAELDGEQVVAINHVFTPPDPPPGEVEQDFRMVGTLSSIYSASYNATTLDAEGEVAEVSREPDPAALATLIPSDYWDSDHILPIWKFPFQPGFGPAAQK
jgi:hypothetical protein